MDNMTAVFNLHGNASMENENLLNTSRFTTLWQYLDSRLSNAFAVYLGLFSYVRDWLLVCCEYERHYPQTTRCSKQYPGALYCPRHRLVYLTSDIWNRPVLYSGALCSFTICLRVILHPPSYILYWLPGYELAERSARLLVEFCLFSGILYNEKIQALIDQIIGTKRADIKWTGAQLSGVTDEPEGVGFNIFNIYSQNASLETNDPIQLQKRFEFLLAKRENPHTTTCPAWDGEALKAGLPLPRDNRGFAGTLASRKVLMLS
ncbi:hypothetical protein ACJ73_01821 [Blastomyces percursus]|uniref:Uncharacterized protein n=1 Tax=Blastomyces percursus TaxID=1658174 RepID=A0A1J9QD81_9EURO|nr:hypothetical protein ACJ73_01821 [Blastomyces percursus]